MQQTVYQVGQIEAVDGTISATVSINPEHALFNGHFPGSPVMPGVMQVEMVQAILSLHVGKSLKIKTIRTCKFLEVLDPVVCSSLRISVKIRQYETLDVTASGESGSAVFFKLQATFI